MQRRIVCQFMKKKKKKVTWKKWPATVIWANIGARVGRAEKSTISAEAACRLPVQQRRGSCHSKVPASGLDKDRVRNTNAAEREKGSRSTEDLTLFSISLSFYFFSFASSPYPSCPALAKISRSSEGSIHKLQQLRHDGTASRKQNLVR